MYAERPGEAKHGEEVQEKEKGVVREAERGEFGHRCSLDRRSSLTFQLSLLLMGNLLKCIDIGERENYATPC